MDTDNFIDDTLIGVEIKGQTRVAANTSVSLPFPIRGMVDIEVVMRTNGWKD